MANRFDIVSAAGERLIAGVSEFDAAEIVRHSLAERIEVFIVPAAGWHRETGRRPGQPTVADIEAETAAIRAGWDRHRWDAQPGANREGDLNYGKPTRIETSAA